MTDRLSQARSILLDPYNINDNDLNALLGGLFAYGADMGDIYFQAINHESWSIEDGEVKKSSFSNKQGVGFRAITGEKSGLAYSESFSKSSLQDAAKAAGTIANSNKTLTHNINPQTQQLDLYPPINPIDSITDQEKIEYLQLVDQKARAKDHRVKEVIATLAGSGWPGVLIHEAIGHGLEGDFNRKKTSAFSGLMGEQVASKICTVIDDGTMKGERGSLNIDDEGEPTQRTVLIEDGKLTNYMQDRLNAKLMNAKSTGNGRRESYASQTIPRMTNTFMMSGTHEHEEIIQSVDSGIYAKNFGGGQVDITSGKFVFSASEAYLIKDGKLGAPVKGAMLIGDGPSALNQVSMIGNNLALDPGIGNCGKDGQTVPVNVGQPTMRIEKLTVGGTA